MATARESGLATVYGWRKREGGREKYSHILSSRWSIYVYMDMMDIQQLVGIRRLVMDDIHDYYLPSSSGDLEEHNCVGRATMIMSSSTQMRLDSTSDDHSNTGSIATSHSMDDGHTHLTTRRPIYYHPYYTAGQSITGATNVNCNIDGAHLASSLNNDSMTMSVSSANTSRRVSISTTCTPSKHDTHHVEKADSHELPEELEFEPASCLICRFRCISPFADSSGFEYTTGGRSCSSPGLLSGLHRHRSTFPDINKVGQGGQGNYSTCDAYEERHTAVPVEYNTEGRGWPEAGAATTDHAVHEGSSSRTATITTTRLPQQPLHKVGGLDSRRLLGPFCDGRKDCCFYGSPFHVGSSSSSSVGGNTQRSSQLSDSSSVTLTVGDSCDCNYNNNYYSGSAFDKDAAAAVRNGGGCPDMFDADDGGRQHRYPAASAEGSQFQLQMVNDDDENQGMVARSPDSGVAFAFPWSGKEALYWRSAMRPLIYDKDILMMMQMEGGKLLPNNKFADRLDELEEEEDGMRSRWCGNGNGDGEWDGKRKMRSSIASAGGGGKKKKKKKKKKKGGGLVGRELEEEEEEVMQRRRRRRQALLSRDPQTVAARRRRERVNERMGLLRRLLGPWAAKLDTASMLHEAASYLAFLRFAAAATTI